jgi:hypothetical protein
VWTQDLMSPVGGGLMVHNGLGLVWSRLAFRVLCFLPGHRLCYVSDDDDVIGCPTSTQVLQFLLYAR